jgi:hypothetical protein
VNKNNEGPKLYSMNKLLTLIPTNNCSETCGCSLFLVTYTNTNSFIANQFAIMSSINQHKMSYNDFNDYKYQQNKINNNKQWPQIICWRGMANNDYIYMGAGSITPRQLITMYMTCTKYIFSHIWDHFYIFFRYLRTYCIYKWGSKFSRPQRSYSMLTFYITKWTDRLKGSYRWCFIIFFKLNKMGNFYA